MLFLPVVLCEPAAAQMTPIYPDVRVIEMPYQNSSGERGTSVFRYGRYNKLRNTMWRLLDGSRSSVNYHLYNDKGQEIEKYREFSDNLTSSERYEYADKGLRIKETFSRSDGVGGTGEFTWDENKRLVSMSCKKYKGWFTGLITYVYEGGRRTGARITRGKQTIGKIIYIYNDEGHLVKEHWDFTGQWSQTFAYRYEPIPKRVYGSSNPYSSMNPHFRVIEESYKFNGEGGGPSFKHYDPEGKLAENAYETGTGLKTVTSYAYNDRGDLVSSHRNYSTGGTADFTYAFNESGRLTERLMKHSDGWKGFEKYEWDRLGRLTNADYRKMDSWLTGSITFTYDKQGRLATGKFNGEDGFDAKLTFESDEHANVLKAHWEFSFGKTQTYFFKYEPIHQPRIPAKPEKPSR